MRTPGVMTGMPGLLQDRQRRLDRFGAEEADDDRRPGRDESPRRPRAAGGGAGIVGDLERDAGPSAPGRGVGAGTHLLAEHRGRAGQRRRDADANARRAAWPASSSAARAQQYRGSDVACGGVDSPVAGRLDARQCRQEVKAGPAPSATREFGLAGLGALLVARSLRHIYASIGTGNHRC